MRKLDFPGKRVYISGPITGVKGYKRRFRKVERRLKRQGYVVINPAKLCKIMPKDASWEEYMVIALYLLMMAHGVYMLRGWEKSKGATVENGFAEQIQIHVRYEEDGRIG